VDLLHLGSYFDAFSLGREISINWWRNFMFYGNERFIGLFAKTCHFSLSALNRLHPIRTCTPCFCKAHL
jgi:hypothetical protein